MKRWFLLLGLAVVSAQAAAPKPAATPSPTPAPSTSAPVVRVNSTNQFYDFARPWAKKPPFLRRGTGAILEGGVVIVTSELVANHTFVEIEKAVGGDRSPAEIVAMDYDANLALLRPLQEGFLDGMGAFALAGKAAVEDSAEILQVESNGEIARTPATVTTIAVSTYPFESSVLLSYRLSSPLQNRDSSFVLPAVKDDKLLGLLMRYDARSQTAEVVPATVMRQFLARVERDAPPGPPRAGFSFAHAKDAKLRDSLGLKEPGGIYITEVLHGSPSDRAGLRRGDVLLSLGGHAMDPEGLYDDPDYGKVLFTHILSGRLPGDPPLEARVARDGRIETLQIEPGPRDPKSTVSEPYLFDQGPRYVVLGGIIFQELSGAFLREWGSNWRQAAPQRLVYLDAFQTELPPGRGKIVFVAAVLPSDDTLGYVGIENLVVTRANGREIRSLEDLAAAAEHPENGFHRIEFEEDPGAIFLDAASIRENAPALARDYGITSPSRL